MTRKHSPFDPETTHAISPRDDPLFLSQSATARLLGVSQRSLERWRLEGMGPAYRKFGRRVLYAHWELLQWADAQRRESTSDLGRRSQG